MNQWTRCIARVTISVGPKHAHPRIREKTPLLKLATKFAPHERNFQLAATVGFRCAELWLDAAVLARWQEVAAQRLGFLSNTRCTSEPAGLYWATVLVAACIVLPQALVAIASPWVGRRA